MDDDYEATFSYHDPFLLDVLSLSIRHLPALLGPVVNVTKKPRKIQWYIKYMEQIERTCRPHLHIQMESGRVVVMVHNRVWIKLKRSSTIVVLREGIQKMRAEAISWSNLKSEVEHSLEFYKARQGDAVDLSNVFIRAWNNLKSRSGDVSLPRQSNYFCGSRLHHWNFVVGIVEIGSGSHDDKREAFRLAAASAAEFLLRLDDGQNEHRWRPSYSDSVSTESSDGCEFMFVRGAGSGPVNAVALLTLSDSSSSTSEDVVETVPLPSIETPQNEEEGNDIKVIESDTATGGDVFSGVSMSSNVVSTPLDEVPPSVGTVTTVIAPRPCRLCEILRMRKPDSADCRQCQMTNTKKTIFEN